MVMVYRVKMVDGAAARTDGVSIWLNEDLNEVEERCAVAHELVHMEMGHTSCQPEYVEMEVRYETAVRLLPDMTSCPATQDLATTAKQLGVTRRVLMDRAVTLTRDQAITAGCFNCLKCPSQAVKMREYVNGMVADRAYREHPRLLRRSVVAA